MSDTVAVEDLNFELPWELESIARQRKREVVDAAAHHGISLRERDAIAAAKRAAESGALPTARVAVPGRPDPFTVVEGATFIDDMQGYFGTSPDIPPPSTPVRQPKWLKTAHRWAWTPWGRRVVERVWRSPAKVSQYAWFGPMRPIQFREEIGQLLETLHERPPDTVLEIGTANGGTTYLLSRFTARRGTVVTCDLAPRVDVAQLRGGAQPQQSIEVLALDSHTDEGRHRLHERLPKGVDVLFIDGDHGYEGVRQDLFDYADLLRPGALLVFHDIVDDYSTRYGIHTWSWVGGVPKLWREVRAALPPGFVAREFVADPTQDGFGIGTVRCPEQADPGGALLAALTAPG